MTPNLGAFLANELKAQGHSDFVPNFSKIIETWTFRKILRGPVIHVGVVSGALTWVRWKNSFWLENYPILGINLMFWAPKEGPTKCYLLNKQLKAIDLWRSFLSDLNPNYDWSKNFMPNFFQCFTRSNWTFQLFKDLVYFSSKPKDIQCENYYKLNLIHVECFVDIWLLIGSSFKRKKVRKI